MEAAISQRLGLGATGRADGKTQESPDEVTELILDGCKIRAIDSADAACLSRFSSLSVLSMNQTTLSSVSIFPTLPSLTILELQDNKLNKPAAFLPAIVDQIPNVEEISFAGNRLSSLTDLLPYLTKLKKLKVLDLELNPIVQDPCYRQVIFEALPWLEVVDGIDRQGQDAGGNPGGDEEDDDESDEDDNGLDDVECLKNFYDADPDNLDDEADADFDPAAHPPDEDDTEDDEEEESGEDSDDVEVVAEAPIKRGTDASNGGQAKRQRRGMGSD